MGVPRTGFRSLNGSAIATRSRSNGFGSVSTSGISVTGYGTQYRSETGRDAIGAALVIIGRYASFSISGSLSLLLLVSASGYASAFTDAYGSLAESNPKTDRFDRPGLGCWIE